jgi:hypothetical protein
MTTNFIMYWMVVITGLSLILLIFCIEKISKLRKIINDLKQISILKNEFNNIMFDKYKKEIQKLTDQLPTTIKEDK